MELKIFNHRIVIDPIKNQSWKIKDEKTKLTYWVENKGEDIKIDLVFESTSLFDAVAAPSGQVCTTCGGSGRI